MPADAMIRSLKALKLYGMAHSIEELAQQGSPAFNQAQSLINTLIKAEVAEREVRSINYQMRLIVAQELGHDRIEISANYIGT